MLLIGCLVLALVGCGGLGAAGVLLYRYVVLAAQQAAAQTTAARQPGLPQEEDEEPKELADIDTIRDGKFSRPPRNAAPTSYLHAVSSKGDYIGQGKTYQYPGDKISIRTTPLGMEVLVDGWTIAFGGPGGKPLEVGEYRNAKRLPFNDNLPGISFSGHGRGCNQIQGEFVVWEMEIRGGEVTRLAIDFVQRCEGTMPPLYGRIRFNSSFQ